jgi:carboxypeptidase family protein/calcineurin-like phosphoesterase family protein
VKFALLSLLLIATAALSQDFTIVLFPDTQNEAQYYPQVLASQTKWAVANRSALNIQMVLGLGDIVNDGASTVQQQNADAAVKALDNAKMPYLLGIGNHDYDNANTGAATRTATGFAHWWGPQRYAGYSWYKGNLDGSNENFYGELTINGKAYLFLILEYVPRSSSLAWASSIVQANPDKEVMVVTHSNMFYDNTRVDQCDTNDLNRDNDGDETWANFTSKYANISMVVSGHITSGLAARRADLGVNGNLVNQMLSNYQVLANGGDGWMRILRFHPSGDTVDVKTFSPYLNAYKTDSKNQFTINWHNHNVVTGSSTITGRVRTPRSASSSCAVISGATVSAGGKSTTTNSTGNYSLTVAPGAYNLTVSASGYATQTQSVEGLGRLWPGC